MKPFFNFKQKKQFRPQQQFSLSPLFYFFLPSNLHKLAIICQAAAVEVLFPHFHSIPPACLLMQMFWYDDVDDSLMMITVVTSSVAGRQLWSICSYLIYLLCRHSQCLSVWHISICIRRPFVCLTFLSSFPLSPEQTTMHIHSPIFRAHSFLFSSFSGQFSEPQIWWWWWWLWGSGRSALTISSPPLLLIF